MPQILKDRKTSKRRGENHNHVGQTRTYAKVK